MKKIITLVLTLALCVPMFLTTSVEVRAEDEQVTPPTYTCSHNMCEATVESSGAVCSACLLSGDYEEKPIQDKIGETHTIVYKCKHCVEVLGIEPSKASLTHEKVVEQCTYKDGFCVCGREEGKNVCPHADYCGYYRIDTEYCNLCKDESVIKDWVITEDLTGHIPFTLWSCGYYEVDSSKIEKHTLDLNGVCKVCHFNPNGCGSSVSENSTPAPAPAPAPAPSAEEIMQMEIEEIAQVAEAVVKAEVEMPVTDFVSAEAVSALPAEVKDSTGDEAVYNLSKITTTRGFVAAVAKMVETNNNSAQKGEAVTFYSSTPFAFNTSSLTALADTATEFVYMFKHEGQLYKVIIPAGAKVDLEGQMFAGPLYIGAKLGTTVVVK